MCSWQSEREPRVLITRRISEFSYQLLWERQNALRILPWLFHYGNVHAPHLRHANLLHLRIEFFFFGAGYLQIIIKCFGSLRIVDTYQFKSLVAREQTISHIKGRLIRSTSIPAL